MTPVPIARILLGLSGIGVGALAFVLAGYDAINVFSKPALLQQLYWAIVHYKAHAPLSDPDIAVFAQVVGELVKVFGTLIMAGILCYIGFPLRMRSNVVPAPETNVPADAGQTVRKDTPNA